MLWNKVLLLLLRGSTSQRLNTYSFMVHFVVAMLRLWVLL